MIQFLPIIGTLLDKLIPDPKAAADAKLKALEMAQRGELAQLDAEVKLALGQMEVNKAEAQSTSAFASSWRPIVGYVCAAGLLYTFLLQPILPWLALLFGKQMPAMPSLDTDALMTLLLGMLGLGGLRSYERVKGVIPKGK